MTFNEQIAMLDKLESLILKKSQQGDTYRSENITDLINDLSKAQEEFPVMVQGDDILAITRPILARHGLTIIQHQRYVEAACVLLTTALFHKSNQWLESKVPMPANVQESLCLILGITLKKTPLFQDPELPKDLVHGDVMPITEEQLEELEWELDGHEDIAKMILDQWKLKRLANMPKYKYKTAIQRVQELKLRQKGLK